MNKKQLAFADEFLKTHNGAKAYMKVYGIENENSARAAASRLLADVNVKNYIDDQIKHIHGENIADTTEIMQFYTSIVRGQIEASVRDRINAAFRLAEMLGVADGIATERLKLDQAEAKAKEEIRNQENGNGILMQIIDAVKAIA